MRILAIETATEMCSVALWQDGSVIEHAQRTTQGHSELVLTMMRDVLRSADTPVHACDALAYGSGPGSFTALRIGVGVAQGIALGAGLPLLGVSSLQALAQRFSVADGGGVLTAFDARMGEVYWCRYVADGDGNLVAIDEPRVGAADTIVLEDDREWLLVGPGVDVYLDTIKHRFKDHCLTHIEQAFPRATEVAELAAKPQTGSTAPGGAQPSYVRDDIAEPQRRIKP